MHNRAVGSAQEKRDRWCDKAVDGNHCFWERYSLSHSSWHSWQVVSCLAAGKTAGTFQHSDAKKPRWHLADSPAASVLGSFLLCRLLEPHQSSAKGAGELWNVS